MSQIDSPATAGERGGMGAERLICAICESPAEWIHHEGCYRHEGEPRDARFANQGFCDKYGYPIPVKSAELARLRAEMALDIGLRLRGEEHKAEVAFLETANDSLQSQLAAAQAEIVELKGTLYAHAIDPCLGRQIRDEQLDAARKRFDDHTGHVQAFLQEIWAVMVDPIEDGSGNVAETCKTLLEAARRSRQDADDARQREEELGKDRDRLDWLVGSPQRHVSKQRYDKEEFWTAYFHSSPLCDWNTCHSAREAIDAAIAAAHPEPGADVDGADRGKL